VKPKNKTFRFVSVFRTYIETTETNRTVSKLTETNQGTPKFSAKIPKYALYQTVSVGLLFVSVLSKIETLCFGIGPKQIVLKQTKTNRNKPKQTETNR
jgi:hypothetical protein